MPVGMAMTSNNELRENSPIEESNKIVNTFVASVELKHSFYLATCVAVLDDFV